MPKGSFLSSRARAGITVFLGRAVVKFAERKFRKAKIFVVRHAMRTKRSKGRWIDELWDGVGRFVNLETTDGVVRYGRMTGLRTRVIGFNGIEEDVRSEEHTSELQSREKLVCRL